MMGPRGRGSGGAEVGCHQCRIAFKLAAPDPVGDGLGEVMQAVRVFAGFAALEYGNAMAACAVDVVRIQWTQ